MEVVPYIPDEHLVFMRVHKVNIDFKQKQRKFNEDFEIRDMSQAFDQIKLKDKVQIDGILGAPFFNKYKWTFDFENLVIWIK